MLNSPTNFFGGSGSVNLTQSLAADYNGNGVVDAADYTGVARNTRKHDRPAGQRRTNTGASAGVIDQADYTIWAANSAIFLVHRGCAEPTTMVLFTIGSLATWIGISFGSVNAKTQSLPAKDRQW